MEAGGREWGEGKAAGRGARSSPVRSRLRAPSAVPGVPRAGGSGGLVWLTRRRGTVPLARTETANETGRRHRGDLHGPHRPRAGRHRAREEGPLDTRRLQPRDRGRHDPAARRRGRHPRRNPGARPRYDGRNQRPHRTPGRQGRPGHHPGVSRRSRARQVSFAVAVRPRLPQAGTPGGAPSSLRNRGTHERPGRGSDAGRRGGPAADRRAGARGGDRGGCRLFRQLLRESGERASGAAPTAGPAAGSSHIGFRPAPPPDSGVRAHLDDRRQRLRPPGRGVVRDLPRGADAARRGDRSAHHHAIERRGPAGRTGRRESGLHHRVGSRRRRRRRATARRPRRRSRPAGPRHGRDDGQGVAHPRRRVRDRPGVGGRGRRGGRPPPAPGGRLSDPGPNHRHRGSGGRGRKHRIGRRGRRVPGRPAERGGHAGARVLRPGRGAPDRHRREPGAGVPQRGDPRRRGALPGRGRGSPGDRRPRETHRPIDHRHRVRGAPDREREHDAGALERLVRARAGPCRVHPGRDRREQRRPLDGSRGDARDPAHPRASLRRALQRPRPPLRRPGASPRGGPSIG